MHPLLRWLINTVALAFVAWVMDGIEFRSPGWAILAAGLIGLFNAFLRPILLLLTLPFNVLTLGLFTFVINALMLFLASGMLPGFYVHSFWTAFWGALLFSIVSWLISGFAGQNEPGSGFTFRTYRTGPGQSNPHRTGTPNHQAGPRQQQAWPQERLDEEDIVDLEQDQEGRWR